MPLENENLESNENQTIDTLPVAESPDHAMLLGTDGQGQTKNFPIILFSAGVLSRNLFDPAVDGTDTRGVEVSFFKEKGAFRFGGSDNEPHDDQMNYGALLPNPNWWGDERNIGVYSFAAGRNSAAFAAYSVAFGHDNIVFGTAAGAGGAGSIAGDPDSIQGVDANQNAYCSFVWGKNLKAKGSKSASFGEEGGSGNRANLTAGYYAITNENSEGIGTIALGYNAEANGDAGLAFGQFLRALDKAKLFGSGINPGTFMELEGERIGFGVGVKYPTMIFEKGNGTTNGRSNIGIGLYGEPAKSLLEVNGNVNVSGGEIEPTSGGNGLYFSYQGNTAYITAIAPGISLQNLMLSANKIDFKANGSIRATIKENGMFGVGTEDPKSNMHVVGIQEYADNAGATSAGLTPGAFYRTGDLLKVVH